MSHGMITPAVPNSPIGSGYTPYVRPADWLAMPSMAQGDQKVAILHKIDNSDNYFAINCTGNYTVDWGDGTTTNTATGVATYKNLAWGSYSAGTLTTRGYRQAMITITPQGGSNLTGVTFDIRHNAAGLGSTTPSGFLEVKCASPQWTTSIQFGVANIQHRYLEGFEFVGTHGMTSLQQSFLGLQGLRKVYGTFYATPITSLLATFQNCYSLEQGVTWAGTTSQITNAAQVYQQCFNMRSFPLFDTSGVSNFSQAFYSCLILQTIPLLNMASCTNANGMFFGCKALTSIPNLVCTLLTDCTSMFQSSGLVNYPSGASFPAATTTTNMFSGSALRTVPNISFPLATTASSMFAACSFLSSVGDLTFAACTDPSLMFNGTPNIGTIGNVSFPAATTAFGIFLGITALQSIGTVNIPVATTTNRMFENNTSMTTVGTITTGTALTNSSSMFNSCTRLRTVNAFNTVNVTNANTMYQNCATLATIPAHDLSSSTNNTSAFTGMSSLSSFLATGMKASFSVASAFLSGAALDVIYGNLATIGGQTITVTSNYGTTGDTPATATGKGWTVTGS